MVEYLKILGGPGCGKSFELMKRYKQMLQSGYNPSDLTLITFRKSSAEDLINMVSAQVAQSEKEIKKHVGTIHSICWRLSGYSDVMAPEDYTAFVKEYKYTAYMKASQASTNDDEVAYSGNLFDLYTWLRNTGTSVKKWIKDPGIKKITMPVSEVPKLIEHFEEYKRRIGKIDYSDMIQCCLDNEIELDTKILMIDEFQDLTSQMFQLFNMWIKNCSHVVVAGDPSQSIYGYLGGSPDYFKNLAAEELRLAETHRLPQQIQNFAQNILKSGGMVIPDMKAKQGYTDPIKQVTYKTQLPAYQTELHLIRCNYQAQAVALSLAEKGKVFGGIKRFAWTEEEVNIANAILAVRNSQPLTESMTKIIIQAYPEKMFKTKKESLIKTVENLYKTKFNPGLFNTYKNIELNSHGINLLSQGVLDSILSQDPTVKMGKTGKLFIAKIRGILDKKTPILPHECRNKMILTIHGSKGLEAEAVYLHTSITARIHSALIKPGKESEAEARVWYVGATRAKDVLYLIRDAGVNYPLPQVIEC